MSYANGTSFLNLPQTVGTDKRDWFDTNEAFLDLDAKVKAAYEGGIDTAAALAALSETVSGLSTTVSDLNTTVGQHTTSITTITEALTLINTTLTGLDTSVKTKFDSAGIADPYDAEHGTYDVDDVVTYNSQRYVCHTAVTAAEPFDADKWTAEDVQTVFANISGDISDINTALTNLESNVLKHKYAKVYKSGLDVTNQFASTGFYSASDSVAFAEPIVGTIRYANATFVDEGGTIILTSVTGVANNYINFAVLKGSSTASLSGYLYIDIAYE